MSWRTGSTTLMTQVNSRRAHRLDEAAVLLPPRCKREGEQTRVREMNAYKLAANLLLPERLVREIDVEWALANFRVAAARWGVSQTTLRIRLETLELIDDSDVHGLRFD